MRPSGLLVGLQGPRTLHLDIVDYPGEWLLDLGLLDLDFESWSAQVLTRIEAREEAVGYLELLKQTDPDQKLEEPQAKALADAFAHYLRAARREGYSDCTPGRFLLPGDLAGSPVLTFAPLPGTGPGPRKSLRRELNRRFEAYKAQVVKPFFRDHFARIDRQVVLVDALDAINAGPRAVEDLRAAMSETLSAFRPGRNGFLTSLLGGKRVEKILFAATKADHLHHTQHPALTAIMEALTRDARDRARFAGAQTEALALASLRATTEAMMTHDGLELGVVRGTLLDSGKEAAFYPGELPTDPAHLLTPAQQGARGLARSGLQDHAFCARAADPAARRWSAPHPARSRRRIPDRRPSVITLREARSTDAGAVGGILSEFVDTTDWMPRLHTRAEDLAHAGALIARGWVTVAQKAGRVIGFTACDGSDLDALYVGQAWRTQGVGSRLLEELQCRNPALSLWTFQANAPAQSFYLRHGFREVDRSNGERNDEGLPDIRYHWQKEAR